MTKMIKAMRLALRKEGTSWNAYVAQPNTMEGAIWIGSIAIRFVEDERRKEAMTDTLNDVVKEVCGVAPTQWKRETPPERDRSGNA
jgi:hypothetical protein